MCVFCVGVAVGNYEYCGVHESLVPHTRRVCGVDLQTRRFLTQSEGSGVHTVWFPDHTSVLNLPLKGLGTKLQDRLYVCRLLPGIVPH